MQITPKVGMIFFRKIRGAGGGTPMWHPWEVTQVRHTDLVIQGGHRDEIDLPDFHREISTGDIYVSLHDEYESVRDALAEAKEEIRQLQAEVDVLMTNNAPSWAGDIVNVSSGKTRTTIMINLQTHADGLLPSAGKQVKIT